MSRRRFDKGGGSLTRTQNSFLNYATDLLSTVLVIFLNFATRTVFIRYLGKSYLGIEGLFTNILSMLSLAELGFGSAIVFKLYKPIEEKDHHRIQVLLKLYRRVYGVIGAVVVCLGVCLIPLLPKLIKDYATLGELGLNPIVIFLLYLFNTASSYWVFAYKTAFVQANQKTYVLTVIGYAVSIANNVCQILALVFFRNFYVYLIVQISFVILRNLIWAFVCDKRYPFVREKTEDSVSPEERKEFRKDCSALFLYRISNVMIGGSDNIVLSAVLGLHAVALYYNYTTVKSSIDSILYSFLRSIQASLGSIWSTGNLEWSRLIFRVVNLFTVWIYGVGGIGVAVLLNEFITLWVGPDFVVTSWTVNGVTIATPVAILMGIELYTSGQKYYCGSFRNAMGLFQELKYRPLLSVLVNLTFSLLLVPRIGIAGCVVSTIIAALSVNLIVDPLIIHRHALKQSPRQYYLRNLLYKLVMGSAGVLTWFVCGQIPVAGVLGFVIRGVVCVILPSLVFSACFFKTAEYRFLLSSVASLIPRAKNNKE